MRDRYDDPDVERLPDFSRLDALFGEGHKCCDKYSNPGIFLAQWAAKELATLTAVWKSTPPNFRTLYLGQFEVDSADFWTNRLLSSSS